MGRKQGKKRKHLFLHGACVLILLLLSSGCATISSFEKEREGHKRLDLADNLTNQGNYTEALKAYGDVVSLFPSDPPGDRALYHMGLIWAHPDNQQNDYAKALTCFQRLVTVFPKSALKNEATVWINVINELLRSEGNAKDLEEKVRTLKRLLHGSKEELNILKKRLDGSKKEVYILKERLNALKEIDIRIEEKKRKNLP